MEIDLKWEEFPLTNIQFEAVNSSLKAAQKRKLWSAMEAKEDSDQDEDDEKEDGCVTERPLTMMRPWPLPAPVEQVRPHRPPIHLHTTSRMQQELWLAEFAREIYGEERVAALQEQGEQEEKPDEDDESVEEKVSSTVYGVKEEIVEQDDSKKKGCKKVVTTDALKCGYCDAVISKRNMNRHVNAKHKKDVWRTAMQEVDADLLSSASLEEEQKIDEKDKAENPPMFAWEIRDQLVSGGENAVTVSTIGRVSVFDSAVTQEMVETDVNPNESTGYSYLQQEQETMDEIDRFLWKVGKTWNIPSSP